MVWLLIAISIVLITGASFVLWFIDYFDKCPRCGSKIDWGHFGYKYDRGYCHSCRKQVL